MPGPVVRNIHRQTLILGPQQDFFDKDSLVGRTRYWNVRMFGAAMVSQDRICDVTAERVGWV
jgi:hypothetical protein